MSKQPRYPRIKDAPFEFGKTHCEIDVTWAEGQESQRFCGDNWCTGTCGLPVLMIPWPSVQGRERWGKASGSQVACGSLMQCKRVEWTGSRVDVPNEHRADFEKRLWW